MNAILALPLTVRLIALAAVGAVLGALVNWIADRVRYEPSLVGPWHAVHPKIDRRRAHYVPIWGWLVRHEERSHFGSMFWLRPVLVELLCMLGLPALYWYQIESQGVVPQFAGPVAVDGTTLHLIFASHAILIVLMLIASLVDLDEKIIPDSITIPGTLIGIMLAALAPDSLLPDVLVENDRAVVQPITLASPHDWPPQLAGRPNWGSLVVGLACFWLWCTGLMPRNLRLRRGWRVAAALFWSRLRGDIVTVYLLLMGLVCSGGIVAIWSIDGPHWRGLLTALVGMALTGGITWVVRFVASASIGREALGFGDVTLMAMIGAFLGWQAGLIVFFLAPFFGLVLGIVQWALHRNPEIPYGPFLCLAALTVMLNWPELWDRAFGVFMLGWIIPALLLAGVLLMGAMLRGWHWVLGR